MSEPIRVLHILQRMEAAGVQNLLMSIYRNIDRTKVQFDFLVHYEEDQFFDQEIECMGGKIYKLSVREDYNLVKYWKELRTFFQTHPEYKIVHGHMPVLGYLYFSAAKKAGVPVRIAHAHTDGYNKSLKGYVKHWLQSLYYVKANEYFACAEAAGKYFFGDKRKFSVIPNAITTDNFVYNPGMRKQKRELLNIEDQLVIGHAARFALHKNHDFLIDVFYEIHQMRSNSVLLLAGDGELRGTIEAKVEKLGLKESVRFLGVRNDINELYQAMDAFVFPSIFEGLGIVNIEAQASGLMTFCSDRVPQEANISPLFVSIPLADGAKNWAEIIVDKCEHRGKRCDMSQYVIDAGYDARSLSNEMMHFYLQKDKEVQMLCNK